MFDTVYQSAMVKGFFNAAISIGIACPFFINGKNDGAAGNNQNKSTLTQLIHHFWKIFNTILIHLRNFSYLLMFVSI